MKMATIIAASALLSYAPLSLGDEDPAPSGHEEGRVVVNERGTVVETPGRDHDTGHGGEKSTEHDFTGYQGAHEDDTTVEYRDDDQQ